MMKHEKPAAQQPALPKAEMLDIATEIPAELRALALEISNSTLLGDPHKESLSSVEITRARALGDNLGFDPAALEALAGAFRNRSSSPRERAVAELLGPPRLGPNGEMHRDTRIVCTIGPKCSSPEILAEMIRAGMDVARLNFSHIAALEEAKQLVDGLQEAMRRAGRKIVILGDLPGPKIRFGGIEPFEARCGDVLHLGKTEGTIPVNPPGILNDLNVNDRLLVDDGKIQLRVEERDAAGNLAVRVVAGGLIKPRKGINLPDTIISEKVPTVRDLEKIGFMKALGIRVVAGSFIETAADVENIRAAYESCAAPAIYAGDGPIRLIAKMERPLALHNAREIYAASDGIMIARGDFAVELGDVQVPVAQQRLHNLAAETGRPCGTATQMLSSLQTGERPLRAEVADVAYSVMQGASFVMTSEETAMADNPVNTVRWMDQIVSGTEKALREGLAHSIARY